MRYPVTSFYKLGDPIKTFFSMISSTLFVVNSIWYRFCWVLGCCFLFLSEHGVFMRSWPAIAVEQTTIVDMEAGTKQRRGTVVALDWVTVQVVGAAWRLTEQDWWRKKNKEALPKFFDWTVSKYQSRFDGSSGA